MSNDPEDQGGIDLQEAESGFNPVDNPTESHYQNTFNPSGADSGDIPYRTGDRDRDSLAQQESSSQQSKSVASNKERNAVASRAGENGGWSTNLKSAGKKGKGLLSSGKKKLTAATIGLGGAGGIVALMFFIIPFLNLMSLEQMTTVMKTYRFSSVHYANFKRASQYTIQESLGEAAPKRGRVSNLLARYSPERTMRNLTQDGVIEFVTRDGKTKWLRRPTSEVTHVIVGNEWIEAPPGGRRNYFKQREFMRNFESAMADADVLGGRSRYFRTKAANELFRAKDIKLGRWALKGRGIKTIGDAVMSLYEGIKPNRLNSSMPEVREAADAFDEGIEEALESATNASDVVDAAARTTADAVEGASGGLKSFARGASFSALAATIYCGAHDYISQQEEMAKAKGEEAMALAGQAESAVSQAKFGDTTATATDFEAQLNEGFEESYAYQRAVGVDPAVLSTKSPDLDKSDSPVVDTDSSVYRFIKPAYDAMDAVNPVSWADILLKPLTGGGLKDKFCGAINSYWGQIGLSVIENVVIVAASVPTGGGAGAGGVVAREGAEEAVKQTFLQAMKGFLKKELVSGETAGRAITKGVAKDIRNMAGFELLIAFFMGTTQGTKSASFETGTPKAAKTDMGYKMLGNEMALPIGGKELTTAEKTELQAYDRENRLARLHKKPLWYRLASFDTPYSVASRVAVSYPKSPAGLVTTMRSVAAKAVNPTYAIRSGGSKVSTALLPTKVAYAATDEINDVNEYNFKTIGFSVSDLRRMDQDSFWPQENAAWVESNNLAESLQEKYGKCYSMLEKGAVKVDSSCTSEFLGTDEALRYRLYRMDGGYGKDDENAHEDYNQGILGQLIDLQDVTTAVTGGESTAPGGSSGPVPDGEVPLSETQVTQGCGGIRVHKNIVTQVENLCSAAAASGLSLAGSGHRSTQDQINLRIKHGCGGDKIYDRSCKGSPLTAVPGRSNHQSGTAIDFKNCSTRSTQCYQWLAANAARFSMFNLPEEPWHWSVDGS